MIDNLQEFRIEGSVEIQAGNNGMPKVVLTHTSGSSAEVYLHGAHVTAWRNQAGEDLLFLSRESSFAPDKPIRGGIPVVFPQFSGQGPLPQHGLVRTREWELLRTELLDNGIVTAELQITDRPETLDLWPHQFRAGLRVMLDERTLTIGLRVMNDGTQDFDLQAAFHTYFSVDDIRHTAVYGLEGVTYIDALQDYIRKVETRPAIRFDQETDRIYVNTPDSLRVEDDIRGRVIRITKRNMPDAVVWNPWIEKTARTADMADDEYQRMVCVETGTIETRPTLSPGDLWEGETSFTY